MTSFDSGDRLPRRLLLHSKAQLVLIMGHFPIHLFYSSFFCCVFRCKKQFHFMRSSLFVFYIKKCKKIATSVHSRLSFGLYFCWWLFNHVKNENKDYLFSPLHSSRDVAPLPSVVYPSGQPWHLLSVPLLYLPEKQIFTMTQIDRTQKMATHLKINIQMLSTYKMYFKAEGETYFK